MRDNLCSILLSHLSELIVAFVSILSSSITACFIQKSNKKQLLLSNNIQRREKTYEDTISFLEKLCENGLNVFNSDYIDGMYLIKPRIKLFASNSVCKSFELIWKCIMNEYYKFVEFNENKTKQYGLDWDSNIGIDENGSLKVAGNQPTDSDQYYYNLEIKQYKENNKSCINRIRELEKELIIEMKKDLKVL